MIYPQSRGCEPLVFNESEFYELCTCFYYFVLGRLRLRDDAEIENHLHKAKTNHQESQVLRKLESSFSACNPFVSPLDFI